MSDKPAIRAFFDEATNTFSYLVADPATKRAAVIDPVLDYDPKSGEVDVRSVEAVLAAAREAGYTVEWSLETHAHADHLSGSPYVKARTGAKIAIGENIKEVQRIFRPVFNATDLKTDGSDFDRLFKDGDRFKIGRREVEVIHTPEMKSVPYASSAVKVRPRLTSFHHLIQRLGKAAKMPFPLHPHMLRHACGESRSRQQAERRNPTQQPTLRVSASVRGLPPVPELVDLLVAWARTVHAA
jgi:hypothetical protein